MVPPQHQRTRPPNDRPSRVFPPSQFLTPPPSYWQGYCNDPKQDFGIDFDDVEFPSGTYTLRGWWVPAQDNPTPPKVAVVCVHGGGRDRRAFLRHTKFFHAMGWPTLLFDFREHGTSDGRGRGFTYGVQEQHDVSAAVRWVKESKKVLPG
jgi:pimeloyl-ACP methyl ester carboxylesterase